MTATSQYDVAIAGAGPAGSSLAIRLARQGLKVLLVEQKRFPRAKLCGEFISPECLTHFAELGVAERIELAGGTSVEHTVFYSRSGRRLEVPSRWFNSGSHALGLSRAAMDSLLLERAADAGVVIMPGTKVSGLVLDGEKVCGVRLKDRSGENFVNARLMIDATGRARSLVRIVKAEKSERAGFVAFKTHLDGVDIPTLDCEIYSYRGGYGGCVRVENNVYNLCFIVPSATAKNLGGDAELVVKNVVMGNKRAAVALRNARMIEDWLAVPIQRYGRTELAPAEGMLTVGDASAFIDPFTGSGILMALEGAKLAANCIASRSASFADLARDYRSSHAAAFDRRLRFSSTLRSAAFTPFVADALIAGLSHSQQLTAKLARTLRPAAG